MEKSTKLLIMGKIKKVRAFNRSSFRRLTLLLSSLFLFTITSVSAQKTITGSISDSNGPLPGASVVVQGTTTGAMSDFDGNYSISVDEGAILLISYVGYQTQTITTGNQSTIDVVLSSDGSLEEVVVTALGIVKLKEKISYSAQTFKAESINQSRDGDIAQLLSGQVAGLSIVTNNGSAVSSSRIVLRGESSLNPDKNQPLIVFDGVLISNKYIGIGSSPVSSDLPIDFGNSLNDLNPDDFDTVTVLKGPKAAALYGERGSNGAVIITSKSGKNKTGLGVSYTSGLSFSSVNRFWDEQYEYGGGGTLNGVPNQYRDGWGGNFGPKTDGQLISQSTYWDPNPAPTPFLQRADREGFFRTGVSYNNNLAVSFSEDDVWGRVSLGRITKEGIMPNTDYKKTNLGVRLGANLNEKISIDLSLNYVNGNSMNVPDIGYKSGGLMYSMLWVMKNFELEKDYWFPNQENTYPTKGSVSWSTSPHLIANENLNGFEKNRVFGNSRINYKINDNLSAFVRVGLDTYTDRRQSRRPAQRAFRTGVYREQDISLQELNTDFLMTYSKELNDKLNLEVNVGASAYRQKIRNKIERTNNLAIKGIYSLANAGDIVAITQRATEKQLNSTYGTVELSYDNKLYFDLSARNDWSSTLPKANQSFFYPSFGISAVISKITELPDFISYLKLRTSFAQTGNSTDPGLINNSYNLGVLPNSTTNPFTLTDANLKSESTQASEFGIDLRLFNNRLNFDVDFYDYSTTNQILTAPISTSTGITSRRFNAGEIKSSGIEIVLGAKPIVTKNFNWSSIFNFSKSKSEVISLTEGIETLIITSGPQGATIEARPGGRMGDIYGRGYVRDPQGNIILESVGGNMRPIIDNNTKKLGNYNPDWTLGISNVFKYKNFDLNIFLDYRNGGEFYSLTGSQLYRSGSITETLPNRESDFVPDGVVENGGTYTKNTSTTTGYDWYRANWDKNNIEANTYDTTFLKLRQVSIGIDLNSILKNSSIENLNVSIYGRNLATWTKDNFVRHFDPEVSTFYGSSFRPGFEVGQLPGAGTYGINIKASF